MRGLSEKFGVLENMGIADRSARAVIGALLTVPIIIDDQRRTHRVAAIHDACRVLSAVYRDDGMGPLLRGLPCPELRCIRTQPLRQFQVRNGYRAGASSRSRQGIRSACHQARGTRTALSL